MRVKVVEVLLSSGQSLEALFHPRMTELVCSQWRLARGRTLARDGVGSKGQSLCVVLSIRPAKHAMARDGIASKALSLWLVPTR